MKIVVFCPKKEFTQEQLNQLNSLGEIIYTKSREEYPLEELKSLTKDADILAFDPDNIGGFEVSSERLLEVLKNNSNLKGLALSTTSYGYVDLDYCQKHNINVTNVPYYSTESVAEHALAFLLGCAKKIFLTDRRTQKDQYRLDMGVELKGKTLGIIGLGNIGTRIADLGQAIGMKVIAWNRSAKQVPNVKMKNIDEVLSQSDAISINLADNEETEGFLSKEKIAKLKPGVIIVNNADRGLVDEEALAEALKTGQVDSYALEAEDLKSPPLGNLENAFLFKGFGWHTKESLERNKQIWVNNIVSLVENKPLNPVKK